MPVRYVVAAWVGIYFGAVALWIVWCELKGWGN
jgi:hypothetical protein